MLNKSVVQKTKKMKKEVPKKKRRSVVLCFKDIKFDNEKVGKENFQINSFSTSINSPLISHKFKLNPGQTPIISKNKKIILVTEDNYDKSHQKGKSPFFISNKINFRNEFKYQNEIKLNHLGLCHYYSKNNKRNISDDEVEYDFSKTPRFNENFI